MSPGHQRGSETFQAAGLTLSSANHSEPFGDSISWEEPTERQT